MLLLGVSLVISYLCAHSESLSAGFSDFKQAKIATFQLKSRSRFKKGHIPPIGPEEREPSRICNPELCFISSTLKINKFGQGGRFPNALHSIPHSIYKSRPPDLASLLLSERIVYIGYPIQQTVAHLVISQLLYLDYDSQEKPIKIYINSDNDNSEEDGLSTSEIDALNIVDVMNYLKNEVITINLGKAYGPAAVILASGTPGKRYVLPRSYTLLKQKPTTISFRQAEDIAIYSDEILKARKSIIKVLSTACGRDEAEVLERIVNGEYMDSQDTVNFGLADKILEDIK